MVKQLDFCNILLQPQISIDLENCLNGLESGFENKLLTKISQPDPVCGINTDCLKISRLLSSDHDRKFEEQKHSAQVCIEDEPKLFSGIIFYLNLAGDYNKLKHVRKLITQFGGVVSYVLNKQCSYMVKHSGGPLNSWKDRTASKLEIKIVTPEFIEDCVQSNTLLPSEQYEIKLPQNNKFDSGIIQVENASKGTSLAPRYPILLRDVQPAFESALKQFIVTKWIAFSAQHDPEEIICIELHEEDGKEYQVAVHKQIAGAPQTPQYYHFSNHHHAVAIFEQLAVQISDQKYSRSYTVPATVCSPQLITSANCTVTADDTVLQLVESVWRECLKEIETLVSQKFLDFKIEEIDEAESIIEQLKLLIHSKDSTQLKNNDELCLKLFKVMKLRVVPSVKRVRDLIPMSELCRIIRDMLEISEATDFSPTSATISKLKALRCNISVLDKTSKEYSNITTQIPDNIRIHNIFRIERSNEWTGFNNDLTNQRKLMHGSKPAHVAGILSRGLLLPSVISDTFDIDLTDVGHLGKGIYFSDNFDTSVKYSSKSRAETRFLFVCDVGLGTVFETSEKMLELVAAPDNCNSVHAIPGSFFKDSEFAVYNVNQQRLRYLIEFCLEDDTTEEMTDTEDQIIIEEHTATLPVTTDQVPKFLEPDIRKLKDPLLATKSGLQTDDPDGLVLKSLHIRGKLVDLASEVTLFQEYRSNLSWQVEAKYVFPLHEGAVVCGFEAYIDDKHLIARIEEKQQARKEYKEAVEKGQGAYLMEEQTPMVFTVSVGNLPAHCTVLIKITFVTELAYDGSNIRFKLPNAVAPWVKDDALKDSKTQTTTATQDISVGNIENSSLLLNIHMPYDIRQIKCESHPVKIKTTATRATVQLCENELLDSTFELNISLAEIHVPRLWVESYEEKQSQAAMLVFYPEFESCGDKAPEIIFLLDMSNSMKGLPGTVAKNVLLLCLENLMNKKLSAYFNIVAFGTGSRELFVKSERLNNFTFKTATSFVEKLAMDMGNSDVVGVLHSVSQMYHQRNRNIILLSDGHLNNVHQLHDFCMKMAANVRVFGFACSESANVHLLRSLASETGGVLEVLDVKKRRKWLEMIDRQLNRCQQPCVKGVHLEWMVDGETRKQIHQCPTQLRSVFNGERLVVLALVPAGLRQFMVTLHATVGNRPVTTTIAANDSCTTTGKLLHRLTVRNLIREWEAGSQCEDALHSLMQKRCTEGQIVELSREYDILCSLTSFVAIEDRSKDGGKSYKTPNLEDILAEGEGDLLDYVPWEIDPTKYYKVPEKPESKLGMRLLGDAIYDGDDERSDVWHMDLASERSRLLPQSHDGYEAESIGKLAGTSTIASRRSPLLPLSIYPFDSSDDDTAYMFCTRSNRRMMMEPLKLKKRTRALKSKIKLDAYKSKPIGDICKPESTVIVKSSNQLLEEAECDTLSIVDTEGKKPQKMSRPEIIEGDEVNWQMEDQDAFNDSDEFLSCEDEIPCLSAESTQAFAVERYEKDADEEDMEAGLFDGFFGGRKQVADNKMVPPQPLQVPQPLNDKEKETKGVQNLTALFEDLNVEQKRLKKAEMGSAIIQDIRDGNYSRRPCSSAVGPKNVPVASQMLKSVCTPTPMKKMQPTSMETNAKAMVCDRDRPKLMEQSANLQEGLFRIFQQKSPDILNKIEVLDRGDAQESLASSADMMTAARSSNMMQSTAAEVRPSRPDPVAVCWRTVGTPKAFGDHWPSQHLLMAAHMPSSCSAGDLNLLSSAPTAASHAQSAFFGGGGIPMFGGGFGGEFTATTKTTDSKPKFEETTQPPPPPMHQPHLMQQRRAPIQMNFGGVASGETNVRQEPPPAQTTSAPGTAQKLDSETDDFRFGQSISHFSAPDHFSQSFVTLSSDDPWSSTLLPQMSQSTNLVEPCQVDRVNVKQCRGHVRPKGFFQSSRSLVRAFDLTPSPAPNKQIIQNAFAKIVQMIVSATERSDINMDTVDIPELHLNGQQISAYLNNAGLHSLGEKVYKTVSLVFVSFLVLVKYCEMSEQNWIRGLLDKVESDCDWLRSYNVVLDMVLDNQKLCDLCKKLVSVVLELLKRSSVTAQQLELGNSWKDAAIIYSNAMASQAQNTVENDNQ